MRGVFSWAANITAALGWMMMTAIVFDAIALDGRMLMEILVAK